ncbi:MAG TPA: threonine-phosphate decarboxylase [Pseudomonas xinjiangensis]|uniref:threonine-phosphate decarboxylase n=2 Tax=root TaxID=1 RepID=A0A7V1BQC8_9GAMM|nr:threonine-phosphate decarboxylase [Halopseudomonas xinjiangensis]HEC46168.1 threonine-phosphate decarboxylase [Halopseudomonas xinjiangensis]
MLEHGGRLRQAAKTYAIALSDWLDLSTGLAPYGWPLPAIPVESWMRLPESNDGLEEAAKNYYHAANVLPVAGSQAAIQALPTLFSNRRVGIIEPCYAEHRRAWSGAGHTVVALNQADVAQQLHRLDVVVVVNPNNPTGRLIGREVLLQWQETLASKGGHLIVDEAFGDLTPSHSLAAFSDRVGLVVLRSLGKFFGLGGARLGFVLAQASLLRTLAENIGPWTVSGPTRLIGTAVLQDTDTQSLWRLRMERDARRLAELLCRHGLQPAGGCDLFQWTPHDRAFQIHHALAQRGILTRLFQEPPALRIGLPHGEAAWSRLEHALCEVMGEVPQCPR